jgi:hypothetical protein
MSDLEKLIKEIDSVIASEASLSLDVRGSYVIGAVLRNAEKLYETDTIIQDIDSYASDLEIRNGNDEQLEYAWREIKRLTQYLKDRQK